jgi:hypothetical protein
MPDLNELKKRLEEIRQAVRQSLPDIATKISLSAKALAERRIKDEGFGEMYSVNKIPAWFLHGKELNQSGVTFLKKHGVNPDTGEQGEGLKKRRKKKGDPDPGKFDKLTNWGEFRSAQGLQTSHVDLSYSNKMWANTQPRDPEEDGDIVRAPLGATNTEAQNKLNWNRDRYGDFIGKSLKPEDFNLLGELAINEILAILEPFQT